VTLTRCPHCGSEVEAGLLGCPFCFGSLGASPSPVTLATGEDWARTLPACQVLGGYGYPIPLGPPLTVTASAAGFTFQGAAEAVTVPMANVTAIDVGGPGRTTSGGGFIGGGFGIDGAVTGMLIATALNALTTRTSTLTVVAVIATDGEVWFGYGGAEPAAVRVELSPAFVAVRRNQPSMGLTR
jgi:hypothetical protein